MPSLITRTTGQAPDCLSALPQTHSIGDFADATAFIDALLLERNMEFLGEGIRNMDLMRTLTTIPTKGGVEAIPSTSPSFIWPIPDSEISTNKLMTGNGN